MTRSIGRGKNSGFAASQSGALIDMVTEYVRKEVRWGGGGGHQEAEGVSTISITPA